MMNSSPADPTSLPPALKLSYFNDAKGRNEFIRLLLTVSNIPYEDCLIGAEFKELRDKGILPYGQLPVLTVSTGESETTYGQSCAIARYVAKLGGLYPDSKPDEAFFTDGIVDSWRDMTDRFYETVFHYKVIGGMLQQAPYPRSARYGRLVSYLNYELSPMFERYEGFLLPSGQLLTSSFPCWADLAIFDLVKAMERSLTNDLFHQLMDGKPKLQKLVQRLEDMECIQEYYKKYPNKSVCHYWVKVTYWRRGLETFVYPVVNLVLGFIAIVQRKFMPRETDTCIKQD